MTLDPTHLFINPGFEGTYRHAFKIFGAHWKTFSALCVLMYLTKTVTAIAWAASGFFLFSSEIEYLISYLQAVFPTEDFSTNYGHPSRLLSDIGDNLDWSSQENSMFTSPSAFAMKLMLHGSLWLMVWLALTSTFSGALIRTTAEAYAGGLPGVHSSLRYGWNTKWRITCWNVLYSLVIIVVMVVFVISLAASASESTLLKFLIFFLFSALILVFISVFSSAMIGALPSIVIENASTTGAFVRSWKLCKNSICSIFCSTFCLSIVFNIISGIVTQNLTVVFATILPLWYSSYYQCVLVVNYKWFYSHHL